MSVESKSVAPAIQIDTAVEISHKRFKPRKNLLGQVPNDYVYEAEVRGSVLGSAISDANGSLQSCEWTD